MTSRASIGDLGILKELACTNQGFQSLSVFEHYDSEYVYYLMHTKKNILLSLASGSTFLEISPSAVRQLKIPLPPTKTEQTAIAKVLSDVDALIAQLEKLITKKSQIKQGAMQTLLNPFDENGKLKDGWSMTTYGEAFDFMSTAAYSRADLGEEGSGYVHYGDIHTSWENHLNLAKIDLPTINIEMAKPYTYLKDGDLIMADASEDYDGIGKSVEVIGLEDRIAISGLHTFLLRTKNELFVNSFKGYIHQMSYVKQQLNQMATGLKVYGVSKNNLKNIYIPRPLEDTQESIQLCIRGMDTEISALESKLAKTKQLKQGMMQSLLTGQVRLISS